jgi:hypothetical protein
MLIEAIKNPILRTVGSAAAEELVFALPVYISVPKGVHELLELVVRLQRWNVPHVGDFPQRSLTPAKCASLSAPQSFFDHTERYQ